MLSITMLRVRFRSVDQNFCIFFPPNTILIFYRLNDSVREVRHFVQAYSQRIFILITNFRVKSCRTMLYNGNSIDLKMFNTNQVDKALDGAPPETSSGVSCTPSPSISAKGNAGINPWVVMVDRGFFCFLIYLGLRNSQTQLIFRRYQPDLFSVAGAAKE